MQAVDDLQQFFCEHAAGYSAGHAPQKNPVSPAAWRVLTQLSSERQQAAPAQTCVKVASHV